MNPVVLPATGRYTIEVSGANGTTGAYTMTLDIAPAQVLTGNETVTGLVDPPGTQAAFVFDAQPGEFITFRVERTSGDLRPIVFLHDPLHTISKGEIINNGDETIFRDFPVLVPGRHILLVSGAGGTSGAFRATMTRANQPPGGPRQICSGQIVGGRISAAGQVDSFAFDAFQGFARLSVAPGSNSTLTPGLVLKDPQGQPIAPFSEQLYSLPANGRYTVEVTASGSASGTYVLSARLFRLLFPESRLAGRFTCTDETHFFFVDGVAGEQVTISMTRLDGDLIPLMALGNSDNTFQVASSNDGKDNARIVTVLPQTGTYTMVASPVRGLGAYLLTMQSSSPAASRAAGPNQPTVGATATPALKLVTAVPTPTPGAPATPRAATAVTLTPTRAGTMVGTSSAPPPAASRTAAPSTTPGGQTSGMTWNTVPLLSPAAPGGQTSGMTRNTIPLLSSAAGAAGSPTPSPAPSNASPAGSAPLQWGGTQASAGARTATPTASATPLRTATPSPTVTRTAPATGVPSGAKSARSSGLTVPASSASRVESAR
jgi:hypothetical protein